MELWQSIPFACIILPLGSAAVTSIMKPRMARIWATTIISIVTVLSAAITTFEKCGNTNGHDVEGYKKNLAVCINALSRPGG